MKIGDLVKLKGDWVQVNPWMKGTELDDSPEEYGIITKRSFPYSFHVEWAFGKQGWYHVDRLEVVCK
jgi:hypothetical protein